MINQKNIVQETKTQKQFPSLPIDFVRFDFVFNKTNCYLNETKKKNTFCRSRQVSKPIIGNGSGIPGKVFVVTYTHLLVTLCLPDRKENIVAEMGRCRFGAPIFYRHSGGVSINDF